MRSRTCPATFAFAALAFAATIPTLAAAAEVAANATPPVHDVAPSTDTLIPPLHIVADGIPQPLTTTVPDAARGRALLIARESANCVLCHAVPDPAIRFSGDVGPSLAGIGARMTVPQLRLRVADNLRINKASVMPSYYKTSGLDRVAAQHAGKTVLTAGEVEDVVAYLATLR